MNKLTLATLITGAIAALGIIFFWVFNYYHQMLFAAYSIATAGITCWSCIITGALNNSRNGDILAA